MSALTAMGEQLQLPVNAISFDLGEDFGSHYTADSLIPVVVDLIAWAARRGRLREATP
jgi:hypothetical protein